ncbi:hypothetical protein [Veillonella magna]|uniref:Uncharacterized protein n=1 Tax=Veillonella magna TaxID=464322 RepID=A0ABS2GH25_9FIRM|nr:hypothetical protein [Veillonella magna]MBM6824341.1 hypothetical protein [Veillonella magna]MBM6912553.1 hypothetical protein [Veillonella magna]
MQRLVKRWLALACVLAVTGSMSIVGAADESKGDDSKADSKALLERMVQALVKEAAGEPLPKVISPTSTAAATAKAAKKSEPADKDSGDTIDLNAVGTTYTANRLPPLQAEEFTIAGLQVGKTAGPRQILFPYQTVERKGPFVTYKGENGGDPKQPTIDLSSYAALNKKAADELASKADKTSARKIEEKTSDVKTSDVKQSDIKPADTKQADAKQTDVKQTEAKQVNEKQRDIEPSDTEKAAAKKTGADKLGADTADNAHAVKTEKVTKPTIPLTTNTVTVYDGLAGGADANVLRTSGLTYNYADATVTSIHIEDALFQTPRHIGVGSTRSEVLFAYGSPQAMWQRSEDGAVLLVYAEDMARFRNDQSHWQTAHNRGEEKKEMAKKEFSPSAENVANSRVITDPAPTYRYLVFTVAKGKVVAVDAVDGQVWPHMMGATKLRYFVPNQLTADDFVLGGYTLNEPFLGAQDDRWEKKGRLYGDDFVSYKNWLVSYDARHMISRVLISSSGGATRRGISIGDTKYLLLYLYGMPTSMTPGEGKEQAGTTVYTYKNPMSEHSYLLFVVGNEGGFIKEIILSDRPDHTLRRNV